MSYNSDISFKLDTLPVGKVWAINPERSDLKEFIEAIKARIDEKGDFLFSSDYKTFKRVKTFGEEVDSIGQLKVHSSNKNGN